VLDLVWALQFMKKRNGTTKDVLNIFSIKSDASTTSLAEAALNKDMNVYYFGRDGEVKDISGLDPGAESEIESGWGGLTEFSGHVGQIVSCVANRYESSLSRLRRRAR